MKKISVFRKDPPSPVKGRTAPFEPDGIPVRLERPSRILADTGWRALFVADPVRNEIIAADIDTGSVLLVIGSGMRGNGDGNFDSASFDTPMGLASAGDSLLIADAGNNAIRRADLSRRTVSTVMGSRSIPGFWMPTEISAADGFIWTSSLGSGVTWRIDPYYSLLRPAASAPHAGFHPTGCAVIRRRLFVAGGGELYTADTEPNPGAVRPLMPLPGPWTRNGPVEAVASDGDRLIVCAGGMVYELDGRSLSPGARYGCRPSEAAPGADGKPAVLGLSPAGEYLFFTDPSGGQIFRGRRGSGSFTAFGLSIPRNEEVSPQVSDLTA